MKMLNLNRVHVALGAVLFLQSIDRPAFADCAGASVSEVKRAYGQAQSLDKQGQHEAALAAYVQAQEYTCEKNPVELDAAKRAAQIALPLAAAAEQRREFERAFRLYDDGGHFAKADIALMAHLRAAPDNPRAFESARSHFDNRALPSFQSNNAVRLSVTGAHRPSPALVAELLTFPAKGIERALQQEAAAFNEQYLRELVQLTQSQPSDLTDFTAVQSATAAHQAFAQKWPNDPIKQSQTWLRTLQQWSTVTRDPELVNTAERNYAQRIEHHINLLTQRYNGAPKLLESAVDYVHMLNLEHAPTQARVAKIKSQARKLADDASAKQRFALAADYYNVSGDDAKAQAARDRMQQAAMTKMQPSIDQMQRQAELLRAQYSDPEKIREMQAQAEAMRQNLQQQQATAKAKNAKSADELEDELGL